MSPATLFLHADAALREVIDQLDPADFSSPVPKEWSELESPTLLGILGRHAYDEAWVPDVIAGRAAADGDPFADVDLLGDDPIASYDALNDKATAAVRAGEFADTFHFTYGDYPADEGFAHLATYRAFQAWSIAKESGIPFHLSPQAHRGHERARHPARRRVASVGRLPAGHRPAGGRRRRDRAAVHAGVLEAVSTLTMSPTTCR